MAQANRTELIIRRWYDILRVKAALARLGRYRHRGDAHGYIDRRLHDAILGCQRDRGLRRDGS